jgi:hypothetical protein
MDLKTKGSKIVILTRAVFVLLLSLAVSSCTVKYSFTGASTVGLSTMSIQYFQNRASLVQPSLSQNLTEALIDKCKAQTNLKLVDELGDVSFEGEISDYKTATLTISGDARAAVNRFTISVKVKFTNTVEPDNSFEQSFSRYEDYDSNRNLSDVEDELSQKIIDMLVEDIFNRAFVNW